MNLIEQLGGYEKAKVILQAVGHEHDAMLLEYRRQHNIFEVGDKVISRCSDNETRIFTYHSAIGKNIIAKCKKGKGYCYPKKWFSHATNEEIKAGKRLEEIS